MTSDRQAAGLRTYRDAVAIVTGGASGIGRALGAELARRGAEVVLADRQTELAHEAAGAIAAAGGRATAATLDVRDAAAVEAVVGGTFARHGRLDYLFNNAGIGIFGSAASHALEDWREIVEVNLLGLMYGVHAAYPRMRRQGFGHLVNTASIAGLAAAPLLSSYAATKHGVVGLSTSLRVEARRHGVRVTVLCPGVVRTPILLGGVFGRNRSGLDFAGAAPIWERLLPIEPGPFARQALAAVAANRAVAVVPRRARVLSLLARLAPGLLRALARAQYERVLARHPEIDPAPNP